MARRYQKNTDQAEISEEDRIKAYLSVIISQMDYKSFNKSIKPELHSAINKRCARVPSSLVDCVLVREVS